MYLGQLLLWQSTEYWTVPSWLSQSKIFWRKFFLKRKTSEVGWQFLKKTVWCKCLKSHLMAYLQRIRMKSYVFNLKINSKLQLIDKGYNLSASRQRLWTQSTTKRLSRFSNFYSIHFLMIVCWKTQNQNSIWKISSTICFLCCKKGVEKLALIKKYRIPLPKRAIFLQSKGNRTKRAKNVLSVTHPPPPAHN